MASVQRSLLDLPSETTALIFENATYHDLAQLCRVSRAIRELAAAELYHNLNHTFAEDLVAPKSTPDFLAGCLETLATSDYNYAGHVKEVFVDTVYAAGKGEQACRQFGYDMTCGKFLNTLLLAALKRTCSLEAFHWNVRIELSTAVFLALQRMPHLRRVLIRLQAGQSLHSALKTVSGPNQSDSSLVASPTSSTAAPPGQHSPGGYGYSQQNPPENTLRMVPKLPVAKAVGQPCSFSVFRSLKSLSALDMDTLEYIPEIAECLRNSLDSLKHLELSLSDFLALKAREKPRVDVSDGGATSDDASSIASQPLDAGGEGAPTGGNPEQLRQWHRARQETILSRIFALSSPDKGIENATNEIVARAESEAHSEVDRDAHDATKDDEDREFVKMMRDIFRDARLKQEPSPKGLKTIEKIERAATKYLDGRTKAVDETKQKHKNKSPPIKIKTPKAAPSYSWQAPHQSSGNYKSYSVHEDVLLDFFDFSKSTWNQMTSPTKNHYVQTYFKGTQGGGYHPYSVPPPLPGKSTSYSKLYYANPNSIPGFMPPSKFPMVPPKKDKKPPLPKPKHSFDSDEQDKLFKSVQNTVLESTPAQDDSAGPATTKEKDDLNEDADMLFPSDNEAEGPDQEFDMDEDVGGDEDNQTNLEAEELKQGINGFLVEPGLAEDGHEWPAPASKGKQAVRDPPNGHLAPPNPLSQEAEVVPEATAEKQEDPVSKYLRLSHGLPIERLAIYLIPVKPVTFLQHFDPYALKSLTLLNVGSQRRIWATLTKLQRQSPLPLTSVFTDNVTAALLTFLESLRAGQLEDLFLLERYLRRKGRVPQFQDCDKTTVEIDAIRKQILKKHMKGLRRLMIRNDDSESWAINNTTMRLIAREGVKLHELAVQCDTLTFHIIVRSLPSLTSLYALQINFILDAGTPPVSMTGVAISNTTHHHHHHHHAYGGGGIIEPHTSASATMLHELRQAVVDGISFCKPSTQLEWIGFSWLSGGRSQSHLDGEGNPYVFLSRVVREVEVESDSGDEGIETYVRGGVEGDAAEGEERRNGDPPIAFWAENDLNISEVQGVTMWDKAVWAGRV